ncbi:MAG: hypothetical protein ACTSW1_07385 [Candidatus Hodarchaeales archaeon]
MSFVLGSLLTLVILVFVAWFDVAFLGRPESEPTFESKVKLYVFVCAWEFLFFVTGWLIGNKGGCE